MEMTREKARKEADEHFKIVMEKLDASDFEGEEKELIIRKSRLHGDLGALLISTECIGIEALEVIVDVVSLMALQADDPRMGMAHVMESIGQSIKKLVVLSRPQNEDKDPEIQKV